VHPDDNVIIALQDLSSGEDVLLDEESYTIIFTVNAKHKFAYTYLEKGEEVIMYGVLVGRAVKHAASAPELRKPNYQWTPPDVSLFKERTFNGIIERTEKLVLLIIG
jgi:altronate hydrolase